METEINIRKSGITTLARLPTTTFAGGGFLKHVAVPTVALRGGKRATRNVLTATVATKNVIIIPALLPIINIAGDE